MSRVMCPMSHITFFLTKYWSLLAESLLSTGPTPSSFYDYHFVKYKVCNIPSIHFLDIVEKDKEKYFERLLVVQPSGRRDLLTRLVGDWKFALILLLMFWFRHNMFRPTLAIISILRRSSHNINFKLPYKLFIYCPINRVCL